MLAIIAALSVYLVGRSNSDASPALLQAERFVESLMKNDLDAAMEMSLGAVRFNIATMPEVERGIVVYNMSAVVLDSNNNHSVIHVTVEYGTSPKQGGYFFNAEFYEIHLLRENHMWLVYKASASSPLFPSRDNFNQATEAFLKALFESYADASLANPDRAAKHYLIGGARKMQERANHLLGAEKQSAISTTITGHRVVAVTGNEDRYVLKHTYYNDGRVVRVLVSYFKTAERGWRIYNVQQI